MLDSTDASVTEWREVPESFRYLKGWASKYGLRGLTVHFGKQPPLEKLASSGEMAELRTAYGEIARRDDTSAISEWCLSIRPETPANEAKEHIRGLLLLFERLADRGVPPFADGRVKFLRPEPRQFDWSVLPPSLELFKQWLKRFEELRTEHDLFEYLQNASETQLYELAELRKLINRDGNRLLEWCEAHVLRGDPAEYEAFQAEWLFLLVDFAKSRIETMS
jgi:hypothetical protein